MIDKKGGVKLRKVFSIAMLLFLLTIIGCSSSEENEVKADKNGIIAVEQGEQTEMCDQCEDGPNLNFQNYGKDSDTATNSDGVSFQDGDDYDVYKKTGNPKIVFVYSNPIPENNNHL